MHSVWSLKTKPVAVEAVWWLKPHTLDIYRHISAADGDTQMQFLNHSEVKFVCVHIPRFCTLVRHRRKIIMDISLAHTQRSTAIAQPIPTPIPMRTRRGAPNSVRWLACVSNNLCMQQPYYVHSSNSGSCISCVCMLRCISTAILNWRPFGRWTPSRVWLPAEPAFCTFGNTLCGRSHRDQQKTASFPAVNPLMTNVWL